MQTSPHDDFALRQVAEDIWIADGPSVPAFGLPIPVRMTAVRLPDGGMWLHSPIQANAGLVAEAQALGPIRHLVAPNLAHFSWLPDWKREAPEAEAWAAPGVRRRAQRQGKAVDWAGELSDEAPPGWAGTIDQMVIKGSPVLREVVFLHRASRTLILTDLIENLEAETLPLWLRWPARLGGIAAPDGKAPPHVRAVFTNRRALKESVQRMIEWAPERVLLAHGRWIERDGAAELRRRFQWAL
jgi:hypothetical protein